MYSRKLFVEINIKTESIMNQNYVEESLHDMITEVTGKTREVADDASSSIRIKYDIWTNPED